MLMLCSQLRIRWTSERKCRMQARPLTMVLVALAAAAGAHASQPTSNFFGNNTDPATPEGRNREGRDFLDLFGLGTGPQTDPYLAKTNSLCLNGDFSECFKSRALGSLDEFFNKEGES